MQMIVRIFVAACMLLTGHCGKEPIAFKTNLSVQSSAQQELPACEWCGAMDAPAELSWSYTISDKDEPGEPLILTGTVYFKDRVTPAPGVLIYAYHTNAEGLYAKKGNETGNGQRHGALRGWVRTDEQGRYRFITIKPAAYPSRSEPAHIHMTLKTREIPEYWIPSTLFYDDPLIDNDMKSEWSADDPYSNIIMLSKDEAGTWVGKRDLVLNPDKKK